MRIVTLSENTSACENLECEHGLSLYIETKDTKILFDMGQTDLFAKNAKKLGIDLEKVDIAVLSHGHYDHGGGLSEFLKLNSKAPVYISKYAFGAHYNGTEKYIGLDTSLKQNQRLIFTGNVYKISQSLTLYHFNKPLYYPLADSSLNIKIDGRFEPDPFLHEQYLEICEDGKRILISGCSHKGILNIMTEFKPNVLVGGMHLSKFELDSELETLSKSLAQFDTKYYTCHCTGTDQYEFMKRYIKDLDYLSTGTEKEM